MVLVLIVGVWPMPVLDLMNASLVRLVDLVKAVIYARRIVRGLVGNLASLRYFLPEFAVTATILLLVVLHVVTKSPKSTASGFLSLLGVGAAILLAGIAPAGAGRSIFEGMVAHDGFAVFFKVLTALATLVVIFMSMDSRDLAGRSQAEYYIFLLSTLLGMFLLSSATDIVMLYLALELVSIPSYLLAGYLKGQEHSTEAAMKYVVYGATASGVMIYGFSLLFGLTGSTQIAEIGRSLAAGKATLPMLLAAVMVAVGFGYKIAAVPFHMWSPDVYEGAPTPATAFFSIGPKAAGFAVLVRFYYTVFAAADPGTGLWRLTSAVDWPFLFAALSALTMTVGNLVAVKQNNVKRLLAYSSIAHAGYMLMGFVLLSSAGIEAILFYLVVYLFMNLGAFYVVVLVSNATRGEEISDFTGLGSRAPFAAVALAIFLFALTGIPPFSGFIGKVYLFAEVIHRGVYWLAVVAALNSVVSLYYYARIVRAMFLAGAEGCVGDPRSRGLRGDARPARGADADPRRVLGAGGADRRRFRPDAGVLMPRKGVRGFPWPAFLATVDFSNPYFAVLVLLVIALAMSVGFVLLSQALGPKRYDRIKYGMYECGVDPLTPAAVRVSVKFYLLAILFILFDLETTFLYPWAVLFRSLGLFGFIEMAVFVGILLVGLVYAWKKGALEWQ